MTYKIKMKRCWKSVFQAKRGRIKKRDHSADRAQGVTSKDLIYLIMPDRFANGDPNNDSFDNLREKGIHRDSMFSRHGGDIRGIMDHLDYLKDLGVTAIWLTPAVENDEPHASYHGYAVTDHYKIDPRYGISPQILYVIHWFRNADRSYSDP